VASRRRVAVTGSSGQLGSAVAAQLAAAGAEVVGLDARPGPHTSVVADVRDEAAVREALAGAEAVVHTASLHAPHVGRRSEREFIGINVSGTQAVLDAAAAHGVRHVVYSSTTSVYGHALEPAGEAVWVDEELRPEPRDVYDVTKLAAERLCELFTAATGVPTTVLRVSRFSFEGIPAMAVPYCLHRAVHVDDAARAHLLALSAPPAGHAVLNVSGASPFLREDVGELLRDAASVLTRRAPALARLMRSRGHAPPARIERVYAIDRAREQLGYRPEHGIPQLLGSA
jgi:nucleoside-diphosphate-sugar epimerase